MKFLVNVENGTPNLGKARPASPGAVAGTYLQKAILQIVGLFVGGSDDVQKNP
jgi:hypothetical protein